MKKRFNVDSPSFTPAALAPNGTTPPSKTPGLSPRTASAAPFKPKSLTPGKLRNVQSDREAKFCVASSVASFSSSSATKSYNPSAPDWVGSGTPEFLPQNFSSVNVSFNRSVALVIALLSFHLFSLLRDDFQSCHSGSLQYLASNLLALPTRSFSEPVDDSAIGVFA